MTATSAALDRTIATLTARLLECRRPAGHWEGRLSSSALSTATAAMALIVADEKGVVPLFHRGLDWLVAHQNRDGGWGDTTVSLSNVSTTALCWAALGVGARRADPDRRSSVEAGLARAEGYLRGQLGDLGPDRLPRAILDRYGKDRTFSVPILTVLAIAGRLGSSAAAWRRVPQLPFELAACPHQLFQWLRLPVVSYALPALVSIGQARHYHAPSRNPVLRPIRSALRGRTLDTLRAMQPASGGFLEATPLTAFVTMSLVAAGRGGHSVVRDALRFLVDSARPDGSWPIDTNLATWVTTLSVNALAGHDDVPADADGFDRSARDRILDWLLAQQHRAEHPYTHAAPGGWAWTDLSGGVPDADDTAGALLALWHLGGAEQERARAAAARGVGWLLDLQNRDGGIPTFCRGWGALPFDRSAPDLTAHALQAWSVWHGTLAPAPQRRVEVAARRAIDYLGRVQRADGSWTPLWFGNERVAGDANPTYGTARVLVALETDLARHSAGAVRARHRARAWLLAAQNPDGGWGGGAGAPSSIEETGLALQALARVDAPTDEVVGPVRRGVQWIIDATDEGRRAPASPIGFYFAKLWYFEELYPLIFALGGLLAARAGEGRPSSG